MKERRENENISIVYTHPRKVKKKSKESKEMTEYAELDSIVKDRQLI